MVQRIAAGRPIAHVAAEIGGLTADRFAMVAPVPRRGPGWSGRSVECGAAQPRRTRACAETQARITRMLIPSRAAHDQPGDRGACLHRRAGPGLAGSPAAGGLRPGHRAGDPSDSSVGEPLRAPAPRVVGPHRRQEARAIPDGGGWRAHGRSEEVRKRGIGYDYVHTAIDDHSRLAYAEIHPDEKGVTAAGFLARAAAFYAGHGINVERVIRDNAFAYRNSRSFHQTAADLGIVQKCIRPHCPWTNGKVERLNRTLATEWAYSRIWSSNGDRAAALPAWLEHYNRDRPHLGIGGLTPIDRVNNAPGQYT